MRTGSLDVSVTDDNGMVGTVGRSVGRCTVVKQSVTHAITCLFNTHTFVFDF